jgi:diguanylate cyclase (GGDEF)-like protein/PAS domain S-box-containing protein
MPFPIPGTRSETVTRLEQLVASGPSTAPPVNVKEPETLPGDPRIARLFEMTSDLLATISLEGRFTLLNPAWEQVLGWTREELQANPVQELIHPDDVEQTLALLLAGNHRPAHLENFTNRYRHRDGSWRWLLWSARCDGDTWYAAAKDVTDRMWLERQALRDPLTHLPNRLLLMDRTRQALSRLHRGGGVVALLFIDLDRFKAVNDNFGHDVGDRLLISVAERLAEMMRDSDTVARLGGDEFVILGEARDCRRSRSRSASARRTSRCRRASASRSPTIRSPIPRGCCARRTSPCIAPRAPAGGAWRCSTSACARR